MARFPPDGSYHEFFFDYMLANKPCVFDASLTEKWKSRTDWVLPDNTPNYEFLRQNFGSARVPVLESSDALSYGQRNYQEMELSEYLDYCNNSTQNTQKVYLKDWHFHRQFPEYAAYTVLPYFKSDWINLEKWPDSHPFSQDYRFVYFGVKNTWTPFHADVLASHSWSSNVCGRKLWYFVPPGKETVFQSQSKEEISDIRQFEENFKEAEVSKIYQESGETVFVPSEWHHQVHNLETTISINHNWINASNLCQVWEFIKNRWKAVRNEISDCLSIMGKEEFENQCQLILRTDAGLDVKLFLEFVSKIAENRLKNSEGTELRKFSCSEHCDLLKCLKSDICRQRLKHVALSNCCCENAQTFCRSCEAFFNDFDMIVCREILLEIFDLCDKFSYPVFDSYRHLCEKIKS